MGGYTTPGLRVIQPDKKNIWVATVIQDQKMDVFQFVDLETEHLGCFQVCIGKNGLYIINMYCQFSVEIEIILTNLEEVLDKFKGKKIIITMDANAKSDWWYAGETDVRGEKLEEFITSHNLIVVNNPDRMSTFMIARGESNIDVTLVSSDLEKSVKNWKVNTVCTTSDHNLITFYMESLDSTGNR